MSTNVIALVRGNERYVFLYDDNPASLLALLAVLSAWLCDDELSFDTGDYLACVGRLEQGWH